MRSAFSEATYDMTESAMGTVSQADARLLVSFGLYPHPNQEKSANEGRPIYEDRVYVMIIVPGDKDSVVHRPAEPKDFQRFPKQYAAFQQNQTDAVVGTPLKMVTWLSASQKKELEDFNVRTVEHLADVNENMAAKMPGLFGLKKLAQDFMRAAREAAPLTAMRSELEKRDSEIEMLKKQVSDLAAMASAAKAPAPAAKEK
jgi:hypothetical protein